MRLTRQLSWLQLAVASCLASVSTARATTYYWDTNGASAGIGSAGGSAASWLGNSWATASTGTSATGAWPNTQPANVDEAVFQGTAGTVNINSAVYTNVLRFQTNNYTLASTGGTLQLAGSNPRVTVNLAGNNQVVTISAPIVATGGWSLAGNSLTGGNKFLVLANGNLASPNSFGGPLTIEAGGALRLGGGQTAEQISDNSDLNVSGVIDFITSGGASNMKQEKVRNVTVSGANSNFSVGNGSDFIVNSMTGTNTNSISINGNTATVPGRLSITGWSEGEGNLTLQSSQVKINATSATSAIGGRVEVWGNIASSGTSSVTNVNGNAASVNTNTFTNKALDFAGSNQRVHVADGVLTFGSTSANHPLEITTTQPAGAVVTKTGAGIWRFENAVQSSFIGSLQLQEGELNLRNPGLASGTDVYLSPLATVNLEYAGIDQIRSFFIDDVPQLTGTWGRMGHPTADFTSDRIIGDGLLQVTTYVPPALFGDFNDDKIVDAGDYTVWRDNLGGVAVLPNDRSPGTVTNEDFDDWKINFGMSSLGTGGGALVSVVPEASSAWMVSWALVLLSGDSRRLKRGAVRKWAR